MPVVHRPFIFGLASACAFALVCYAVPAVAQTAPTSSAPADPRLPPVAPLPNNVTPSQEIGGPVPGRAETIDPLVRDLEPLPDPEAPGAPRVPRLPNASPEEPAMRPMVPPFGP